MRPPAPSSRVPGWPTSTATRPSSGTGSSLVPAGVRFLDGDLAEPEAMLGALPGFIDLSRPACLVLTMVLHVLDPGTARAVAGVLVRALAPGSYLVLSAARGSPAGSPTPSRRPVHRRRPGVVPHRP